MSKRSLTQISMRNPEFVDPDCLERGTVPWLLARHGTSLFPQWLFSGWRGEKRRGRPAWPALILMKMLCLRWIGEGMPRTQSVEQAKRNTTWRAALGLEMGDPTPSERTIRDFERFLQCRHPAADVPRYLLVHEHLVRVCLDDGIVGPDAVWSMDSTPMWCHGAVLDTMRLLGDGLRALCLDFARLTGTPVEVLAEQGDLGLLTAKSTKGFFAIDWRDGQQRADLMDRLARLVLDVVRILRRHVETLPAGKRKRVLRRARHLTKVIRDDLEVDDEGRLVVARRVARDRLVSLTDPQARHGRKSRQATFHGYKVHVLGDVVSGIIASLSVTPGNAHDGSQGHRLIRRARAMCQDIEQVLADTAYGGARLRHLVRGAEGIDLVAPPPPHALAKGRLGREHITIDFEAGTATCAAGVETTDWIWSRSIEHGTHVRRFSWSKTTCDVCSLSGPCRGKDPRGNWVKLHPYEQELRAARRRWNEPEVRQAYRVRTQCERLVNQITRHGGRKSRAFGLAAANLQAHVVAMRCNLDLLARALADRDRTATGRAA